MKMVSTLLIHVLILDASRIHHLDISARSLSIYCYIFGLISSLHIFVLHLIRLFTESMIVKILASGNVTTNDLLRCGLIFLRMQISVFVKIRFNTHALDILELLLAKGTFTMNFYLAYLLLVHLLIKLYNCIAQIEIHHLYLMFSILFTLKL